jgi:hypothetical protein
LATQSAPLGQIEVVRLDQINSPGIDKDPFWHRGLRVLLFASDRKSDPTPTLQLYWVRFEP